MVTCVILSQRLNVQSEIVVILSGIVIEFNPEQKKAFFPILLTVFGMVIEVSFLQESKAFSPIIVTLLGIIAVVRLLQQVNA